MKVESVSIVGQGLRKTDVPAEQVERHRKDEGAQTRALESNPTQVQPEEVLDKIKALTEEGVYSVRFEQDDASEKMIIRLVEKDSGEEIRQIPPEELVEAFKDLKELRGVMVNTQG